jgi:hypothetical protein
MKARTGAMRQTPNIGELERGTRRNDELTQTCRDWLAAA